VMAVVALVATLAVPAVEGMTGANARKAAGELAGTMRAMFDTAALRNCTCRVVLDFEKRAFSSDCAPGKKRLEVGRNGEIDDRTLEERYPGEKDAELRRILAQGDFQPFQDRLVQARELPGNTHFGPVHVEGRRDTIESGVAYVHFFPGGRAQRACVPVIDGRIEYTIVVEPSTGRARVMAGKPPKECE
jgi:general secretion pathway protein H